MIANVLVCAGCCSFLACSPGELYIESIECSRTDLIHGLTLVRNVTSHFSGMNARLNILYDFD